MKFKYYAYGLICFTMKHWFYYESFSFWRLYLSHIFLTEKIISMVHLLALLPSWLSVSMSSDKIRSWLNWILVRIFPVVDRRKIPREFPQTVLSHFSKSWRYLHPPDLMKHPSFPRSLEEGRFFFWDVIRKVWLVPSGRYQISSL